MAQSVLPEALLHLHCQAIHAVGDDCRSTRKHDAGDQNTQNQRVWQVWMWRCWSYTDSFQWFCILHPFAEHDFTKFTNQSGVGSKTSHNAFPVFVQYSWRCGNCTSKRTAEITPNISKYRHRMTGNVSRMLIAFASNPAGQANRSMRGIGPAKVSQTKSCSVDFSAWLGLESAFQKQSLCTHRNIYIYILHTYNISCANI